MNKSLVAIEKYWFEKAPAERPAILRILVGVYVLYRLVGERRKLVDIARSDPSMFQPVGVASLLDKPLPVGRFKRLFAATLLANVAFILGWRHRYTGPLFAGLLLLVFSYRESWSAIRHTNNVVTLHALILGLSSSADALSLDALKQDASLGPDGDWRYGWPVRLMSAVTALTYLLAGVAKVKGPLGWGWAGGEALRSHIAASGLRKDLLSHGAAPLAYSFRGSMLPLRLMGVGTLLVELMAPLFLFNKTLSRLWAISAFAMHWGIYFTMKIKFRYQMTGLIFASLFDLDRLLR